jgi:AraC-like DNA-binding protein
MYFNRVSIEEHVKIKADKNYTYIFPHPILRKYIAHYTICVPDNNLINLDLGYLNLIPDSSGCIVCTYENNKFNITLWGATTKIVTVKNDMNDDIVRFFIEFLPGGLHAITGIKQSELCDVQTSIEDVNKDLYKKIIYLLENSKSMDNLITSLNSIFIEAIEKNSKSSSVIESSLITASNTSGIITIKDLASAEYISERQLNRLFNEYIGMSTKMFLRLVRINNTINLLKATNYNLSDNAQILGFYDQSHFIRDFKAICGVTPKSFLKNMSDFYNEEFKY